MPDLLNQFINVRKQTVNICQPLQTEDYVVQPVTFVSPPKWHIGHTTWFYETFILKKYDKTYTQFNSKYEFVFNSYYQSVGLPFIRHGRGNLSRPSLTEVLEYKDYVDKAILNFLSKDSNLNKVKGLLEVGLNHEQQHQELLYTDIKFILGNNPLLPKYSSSSIEDDIEKVKTGKWIEVPEGVYEVGFNGENFAYDNESPAHKVYINSFDISGSLISNGEFLEFINDGGYSHFEFWHSEAWEWVQANNINSPLYWHLQDNNWFNYTLNGPEAINKDLPVMHLSFYEAFAFAEWKGMRLPTEFEWEAASNQLNYGKLWEITESAYLPYPGFKKPEGALGEYNGKFMVNQKVFRGHSVATPKNHERKTYRNFFHPDMRWQYQGVRLVKK